MPSLRDSRLRRTFGAWLCLLVLTLSACGREAARVHESQLLALGTLVEVSVWGGDDEQVARAVRLVERRLQAIDHDLHAWHPGPLVDVNTGLAAGRTVTVSAELARLVRDGQAFERQSQGRFDPAIGRLIRLWGFQSDEPPQGPPPAAEAIAALLAEAPAMADLQLDGHRLSSRNRSVQLDLGAYAKGYAIDAAIAILRRQGITDAIVNAGGDLRAIGRHGSRPWRIGVRDPSGKGVIASLQLSGDRSVVTSGNYERYYEYEGRRYHHIIDPRTGRPARGLVSMTVVAGTAEQADAASTALFVAGPGAWPALAARMGIDEAMAIDERGHVAMTRAMAARVRFEVEPPPAVEIVEP